MKIEILNRTILLAKYINNNKATIRQTAGNFSISKSTVHNDIAKRLKKIDAELYNKIRKILENNFKNKHIRGGQSTKNKYLLKKM